MDQVNLAQVGHGALLHPARAMLHRQPGVGIAFNAETGDQANVLAWLLGNAVQVVAGQSDDCGRDYRGAHGVFTRRRAMPLTPFCAPASSAL